MRKNVKELMNEYMCKEEISKEDQNEVQLQCLMYGYLTGYFGEKFYDKHINQVKNSEYIKKYNLAVKTGIKDRLNLDNGLEYLKEKIAFVRKLAIYDAMNGITDRELSEQTQVIYDNCQDGIQNKLLNSKAVRKRK